jgi:two-component system sensor histidine kinase ChiS
VLLAEVVNDAVAESSGLAEQKRLHIEKHFPIGSPIEAVVAAARLQHLLSNVVAHAVSTTANASSIEVTAHDEVGDFLRITISDSGTTYSPADIDALFDANHDRGDSLRSALSLHAARKLARAIGGDVSLKVGADPGSAFEIRVPATVTARVATSAANQSASIVTNVQDIYVRHRQKVDALRVLVVEDQPSNRHVIVNALARAGHSFEEAETGDEAFEKLRGARDPFDVVILDLGLPGLGGFELMKTARVMLGLETPPFIVLTGETSESVRLDCKEAGAWHFLSKPIASGKLLSALQAVHERLIERKSTTIESQLIDLNVATSYRDTLRFAQQLRAAAARGEWVTARAQLLALVGSAALSQASRTKEIATQLFQLPEESLPGRWAALSGPFETALSEDTRALERIAMRATS